MGTLVGPLASGLADAPSGTVEAYLRDSTDQATLYSDWECTQQITAPSLDAYGRLLAFVKDSVDVRVRRADASEAITFPVDVRDKNVEVVSPSFTGALPSGSTGLGGSTDLNTILSKLADSFGAADFLVRRTGATADQTLKAALASITASNNTFFVVTTYGAVGDGVTDDSSAIQAAIDAAVAAGGGIVWFPPGIYYLGGVVTVTDAGVRLVGAGIDAVELTSDVSPTVALQVNQSFTTFAGLLISDMTLNTDAGTVLSLTASPGAVVERCRFTGDSGASSQLLTVATRAVIRDCEFADGGNAAYGIDVAAGGAETVIEHCNFVTAGSATAASRFLLNIAGASVRVRDCTFDFSLNTEVTGQYGVVVGSGAGGAVIENCKFTGPSGILAFGIRRTADVEMTESGNVATDCHIFTQFNANFETTCRRFSRVGTIARSASTTLIPRNDIEGYWLTANNNVTVDPPSAGVYGAATNGAEFVIWIYNSSGGNITITWDAAFRTSSTGNLATLSVRCIRFRYNANAAAYEQVGGYGDYLK